jgi:hypothetical protein
LGREGLSRRAKGAEAEPRQPQLKVGGGGMKSFYQEEKKPEVPAGMRLLKAGEKVQKGDQKWMAGRWTEIVEAIEITVAAPQVGFYCRKV